MTVSLMPQPRLRFFTNTGAPAAGYMLYCFAAGTSTPLAAFQDPAGLVPHENPIHLDEKGEALVYFSGNYKIDLRTPWGATVSGYPVDNYQTPSATNSADALAASGGSALVGYPNNGTPITAQAALDLLYYGSVNVRNPRFAGGAKGDGVTDDTAAIQAAANAAGYGGTIIFPGVNNTRYKVSATITLRGATKLIGPGVNACQIYRTGDYGDTFVCGSADSSEPARNFLAQGIYFAHDVPYVQGSTTIANKVTQGAHLRIRGAQEAKLVDCWFSRLTAGIVFEGGSWVKIKDCQFSGVYDPTNPALQEGFAQVIAQYSAVHGNPTTWLVTGCNFLGATITRNVSYVHGAGTKVVSRTDTIGSQYGFYATGLEDLVFEGNYLGGHSVAEVGVVNAAGGGVIDWRITKNFFDGIAKGAGILFAPATANLFSFAVHIEGNTFTDNQHAIFVNSNPASLNPTVYSLDIVNNTCVSGVGTQLWLAGARAFTVEGNKISDYNKHDISAIDTSYSAGVVVSGYSSAGIVTDNIMGGGTNIMLNDVLYNFCYQGIVVGSGMDAVQVYDNMYTGIRDGTHFRTGLARDEGQATATADYQTKSGDGIVLVNNAGAVATAIALPIYPVLGRSVLIKDAKGDAATNAITVTTNDSTSIDGVATSVLSTNYGSRWFRFNGVQWNVM